MHINHPQSRQNDQMNWLFFPWPSSLSIMIIVMIIAFTNMESESLRFRVPPPKMLHLIHSVCKPYVNAAFNIFRVYLTGPLGIVLFITSPYICLENKSERTNIFSMVNNLKWFERKTRLSSHMRSVRLLSLGQNSLPHNSGTLNMLCCALYLYLVCSPGVPIAHNAAKSKEKPVRLFILNDFLFDLHMWMSNTFHEQYGYSFLVTNFYPSSIAQRTTIESFKCIEYHAMHSILTRTETMAFKRKTESH